MITSQFWV